MKIIRWAPDELLNDDFFNGSDFSKFTKSIGFDLAVDVYEDNGDVVVKMAIPGIDPEKIDLSIDENILSVIGKREDEQETKDKNYYRKEIRRGEFKRVVELPANVLANQAKAECKDGELKIIIPKKASAHPEKIKIAVNKK